MSNKSLISYGVVGGIGILLIIVSMSMFAFIPPIIEDEVYKSLAIGDTESEGYKNFVSTLI